VPEFFTVVSPDKVFEALSAFPRLRMERVKLDQGLHRVTAREVISPEDLPPRARATMDGYAVQASDTFGASASLPAVLQIVDPVVMGMLPGFPLAAGQAAQIPTGGFLPEGADAVVMVEYSNRLNDGAVEIFRPVTPGENVLNKAEDVALGKVVIPQGRRLRPHDVGMLAGLGILEVPVGKKPTVAVISTGDEIVPVSARPLPGQIRDINSHALRALAESTGAKVSTSEIVPDEPALLTAALEKALADSDVVVLSGGSSVGQGDHLVTVVSSFAGSEILVHGVAISPGKPTLLARVLGKPVFGLPGHPVSALVVAQVFVAPFLRYLEGEALDREPAGRQKRAMLVSSAPSAPGREEYVRVLLERRDEKWLARPVFGKSGMLSSLVRADGFFVIPGHVEGIARGETVTVHLF
jgi:molybdopterin molybdotransferase